MNTSAVSPEVGTTISPEQVETLRIIKAMGGQAAVARFFGVSRPAVNQWVAAGIPAARLQTLQYAKPELFATEQPK